MLIKAVRVGSPAKRRGTEHPGVSTGKECRTDVKTYYEILGVSRTAETAEITSSYRRLVAKYHPDRHQGNALRDLAEEKLKALNEAHEVLSKPNLRREYDSALMGRTASVSPGPAAQAPDSPPPLALIFVRWMFIGGLLFVAIRLFREPRLFGIVLAGWLAWRFVRQRRR